MKFPLTDFRPRGALAWIFGLVSVVLVGVLLFVGYYMLRPVGWDGAGRLGVLGLSFAPQLLGVTLAAALLGAVACRWRATLAALGFAIAVALSAVMSLLPTLSQYQRARSYGASASLIEALVPRHVEARTGTTVTYAVAPDGKPLVLDVWRARSVPNEKLRPAIVKIHGGGWNQGSRGEMPAWNAFFTELGYDVFDIDYRMPPRGRFRDEVGDVKCAIGWLAANAARYSVDPTRISVMGHSAGANLALLAAYSMGNPLLPASCSVPAVKVRSAINLYGPTHLQKFYESTGTPRYVQQITHAYIGGAPLRYSDRYDLLSPVRHVKPTAPPTITLHGEADRLVPREQAELLDAALEEYGVRHETYYFPWADHGFDIIWGSLSAQTARAKIQAFLRKYG